MEIKNLLHSEKVVTGNKTYFLDLKKAKNGRDYLVITQQKRTEGQRERIKMILFEDELKKFGKAFSNLMSNIDSSFKNNKRITNEEIEEIRKIYPRAYEPWTREDDDELRIMALDGSTIEKMASFFQRKESAVQSRMIKLNVLVQQGA